MQILDPIVTVLYLLIEKRLVELNSSLFGFIQGCDFFHTLQLLFILFERIDLFLSFVALLCLVLAFDIISYESVLDGVVLQIRELDPIFFGFNLFLSSLGLIKLRNCHSLS